MDEVPPPRVPAVSWTGRVPTSVGVVLVAIAGGLAFLEVAADGILRSREHSGTAAAVTFLMWMFAVGATLAGWGLLMALVARVFHGGGIRHWLRHTRVARVTPRACLQQHARPVLLGLALVMVAVLVAWPERVRVRTHRFQGAPEMRDLADAAGIPRNGSLVFHRRGERGAVPALPFYDAPLFEADRIVRIPERTSWVPRRLAHAFD